MTAICPGAIHLCAIRATRLDSLGNPLPGPNNLYVSNESLMLSIKPEIESGQDKVLVGGCDCVLVSYRGKDKLKRYALELDQGLIEPGLSELLLGGSAILSGGSSGDPIGMWFPSQLSCNATSQPNVCFEGWQDLWEDDHPVASPYKYLHWIFPSSYWQDGDRTLQNDFDQPKFTAFTRSNPNWGLGIYGDLPEAAHEMGGWFYTNTIPIASCTWQSHGLT